MASNRARSGITSVLSERPLKSANQKTERGKVLNPEYNIFRDQPTPGASPLRINTLLSGRISNHSTLISGLRLIRRLSEHFNGRFLRHRFSPKPKVFATPISLPKRNHVAKEAVSAAQQTSTRQRSERICKPNLCSNDEAAALRKNHFVRPVIQLSRCLASVCAHQRTVVDIPICVRWRCGYVRHNHRA